MIRRFFLLLISSALVLTPAPAGAHSALIASSPKSAAILTIAPKQITLTFNENLLTLPDKDPSRIQLFDAQRKVVRVGPVKVIGEKLQVRILAKTFSPGRYRTTYRAVSADGHVITGNFSFTYKPAN